MHTYFFDMKDGVPLRDRVGLEFMTNADAIQHCREVARHIRDCSLRDNPRGDALPITAITQSKEQTLHETVFIYRIRSLRFCARSSPVGVGNAGCKPECTYRH
jgi:hypothetical protein